MKGYVIKRAGAADSFFSTTGPGGRPIFEPRGSACVFLTVEGAQLALRDIRPFVGTARFDIICAYPDREEL